MTSGIPYDSDEGRAICGAITAIMTGTCYSTSAEMACEHGAFTGYLPNAGHMARVMRNHQRAAHGEATGYEELSVLPVPLDHASLKDPGTCNTRQSRVGQCGRVLVKNTATATPSPRLLRPPAPLVW